MHSPVKILILTISFFLSVFSRQIILPSINDANLYRASFGQDLSDVDIVTNSQFSGLTTFARLPYLSCFDATSSVQSYDIAILGAPFDTVSGTNAVG